MKNSDDPDLWQFAKDKVKRKELQLALALGFDRCEQCGEWFHHEPEDWVDCAGCGRYCTSCADLVTWVSCDTCSFTYCQSCHNSGNSFVCPVCSINS
jgi:hypothetical protein